MASRTLNVLLTADSKGMAQGFASSIKSSMGLKAGLAAAALGAAALGKAIYDVGEEFDDAADTIRVGTGKTGKALEKLEDDFKNVVSSVPTDFESASEAVAELNKRLGITGKPLRERSKQFLELSRITKSDVVENIKSVTRAFGDWEVKTGQQGKQLDKFFRASQLSGASVSELAGEVVKFGAPLRQVGFTLDEATAMFASFEKAGVNTSTMLPGLKMAMKVALQEDKDPAKFIKAAFKGIEDGTVSSAKALDLFGQKAGGDMIEAVEQGRFHLDAFTKTIATGNDTIRKAGKETMDTSENMQLLGNKIKVFVAPAAEWLYTAVGKVSKAFATMNFKPLLRDLGLSSSEMKSLGTIAKVAGQVWQEVVLPLIKGAIGSIMNQVQGFARFMKGVVRVIGALLRGDFGEAWEGVKGLFRTGVDFIKGLMSGLTKPMRVAAGLVDKALTGVFGGTWDTIKGVFEDGANAAIRVLNTMIGLINKIPFVEIGEVGYLGGGGGGQRGGRGTKNHPQVFKQRGGPINLGAPTGDTVPAMLERGEYVLNRNAVRAVGTQTLDAINYGMAPRFQKGGPVRYLSVGSFIEDAAGVAGDVAGYTPPGLLVKGAKAAWSKGFPAVANAVEGISNLGGKFPSWIDGGYFVNAAIDWLKGKTEDQGEKRRTRPAGLGKLGGAPGSLGAVEKMAASFGLSMTSGYRPWDTDSWHGQNRARDFSNSTGPTPEMMRFALAVAGKYGSRLLELIYTPLGWSIDNGAKTAPIAAADHYNHVHVAMQKGGRVKGFQGGGIVGTIGSILLRNGLDKEAAAGIIGNAYGESSWNPASIEPGTHNGGLWGFTASPVSLAEMKAYAESQGMPWTSAKAQTQFMLHNLSSSQRSALNSLGSVAETTEWFMANWERPASMASLPTRISAGQKALKMLGGLKAGKGSSGGSSAPKSIPAKADPKTGGMQAPSNAAKGPNTEPRRLAPAPMKVPKILQGVGMKGIEDIFRSPGINPWEASELALDFAEDTPQTWDERQVMKFQLNYSKDRKHKIQKEINRVNKRLAGRLTDKQRTQLLAKRKGLYAQLGTQNERIDTAREGLKGEGLEAAEDPLVAAMEAQTKAIEEQKAVEEEHTATMKGLQAQMKEQTDFAKSATAESAVSGMMAVADMLSGMLGGSAQQAAQLAGAGGIGSVGRF